MSYRIFCILLVFSSLFYSAQDIEVMEVTYENHISYLNFHNKKTVSHDEIDTSKNLSLITNNIPNFKDLKKCNNKNCYTISINDTIVSSDFILPSNLNIKDKLNNVKPYMKDYINNLVTNQKVLKKKSGYILYQNDLKNVILIGLKMTKSYYNMHTANLKLCGNPNDKIVVYRFLNGNDEYEIEHGSL